MTNFCSPHVYDFTRLDYGQPSWHPADRFMGSFFGLMLGDIMGSYFEFSSAGSKVVPSARVLTDKTNVFGVRFGYTDDTILALLGMEALMASGHQYDQNLQFEFARKYLQSETTWSPNGRCFDMGGSTRQSLTHGDWPAKRNESNSGNGVLMKLAPYAWHRLITQASQANPLSYYREVADLTHGSQITVDTAHQLGTVLEALYLGVPWPCAYSLVSKEYPRYVDLPEYEYRGYSRDAMVLALWLMYQQYTWDDALKCIMDLGGDTDTHAAIFGMLYGAAHPDELVYRVREVAESIHEYQAVVSVLLQFVDQFGVAQANWIKASMSAYTNGIKSEFYKQVFPARRWQQTHDMKPLMQTALSPELLALYKQTAFVVFTAADEPEVTFLIGSHNEAAVAWMHQQGITTAAFITAYNPKGESLADSENTARHFQLIVQTAGLKTYEGEGRGAERNSEGSLVWPAERSLLVANLSRLDAEALGNNFEQNAIVWITDFGAELMLLR